MLVYKWAKSKGLGKQNCEFLINVKGIWYHGYCFSSTTMKELKERYLDFSEEIDFKTVKSIFEFKKQFPKERSNNKGQPHVGGVLRPQKAGFFKALKRMTENV